MKPPVPMSWDIYTKIRKTIISWSSAYCAQKGLGISDMGTQYLGRYDMQEVANQSDLKVILGPY